MTALAVILANRGVVSGASPTPLRAAAPATAYHEERDTDPTRTVVTDASGRWLATFTDGAYTVTMAGPSRTLEEPPTHPLIALSTEVRLLDAPFAGEIDDGWLERQLVSDEPDTVDIAMQYVKGAPDRFDRAGQRVAGDANYGPLGPDGARQEGSDFYDYLGLDWPLDGRTHRPSAVQADSLDCSGFVRMVFGFRGGLPLGLDSDGARLPRRAFQILDSAPGVVTIPNSGARPESLDALATGDLVFFDADPGDGPLIDHVGMYLGRDLGGHPRFISSRKTVNGPTLGDVGGRSVLDGDGLYARSFRAARRL